MGEAYGFFQAMTDGRLVLDVAFLVEPGQLSSGFFDPVNVVVHQEPLQPKFGLCCLAVRAGTKIVEVEVGVP